MEVKDSIDYIVRIVIVLIPLIWKATEARRSDKGAGKRLHYVVWKAEKATWLPPKLRQLIADALERKPKSQPSTSLDRQAFPQPTDERHVAELFIWNAGIEDITEDEVFDNYPLYIDLIRGEIESYKIKVANHDVILKGWTLTRRTPESSLVPSSSQVLTTVVKHWPPNSGVVIEFTFKTPSLRAATFSVCGPMRHLRERKFRGRIWRIDLRQADQLPKQLAWATLGSWASGLLFLVILTIFLFHLSSWTIGTWQYLVVALALLTFECAYFITSDKRYQIGKKICPSLRYWLPQTQ